MLLSGDAKVKPIELPMRWEDEDRQGAHFVLPGTGTWHPVVKLGDRIFRAPPVTLPWVPEFEPAPPREGRNALVAVAKAGSGVERLAMTGLFAEGRQSFARVPLAPVLVMFAVLALVAEVFVRRFLSGPRAEETRREGRWTRERRLHARRRRQAERASCSLVSRPSRHRLNPSRSPRSRRRKNPLAEARERARKRTQR